MPPRDWRLRVDDILEASRRIQRYTVDQTLDSLRGDSLILDALVKNFAVIGEVSRHITEDVQRRFPEVPWQTMRDMRNVVVHQYFDIDTEILWRAATRSIPELIPMLERILEAPE